MKNILVASCVILFLVGGLSLSGYQYLQNKSNTGPVIVHGVYVTDLFDDKKLVGASSNVFVGKILKKIGTTEDQGGMPLSQFTVEVLKNVKGNLSGSIQISQEGGYKDGILYISEGDISYSGAENNTLGSKRNLEETFLKENEIYLLVAIHDPKTNIYHVISHPNGKKHFPNIHNDQKGLSEIFLDKRILQLKKAYTEEIPFEAFAKEGRNENAYSSLSDQKKEQLLHNE